MECALRELMSVKVSNAYIEHNAQFTKIATLPMQYVSSVIICTNKNKYYYFED